ncbi:monovalent cation/H+ antiporter complex subunit F [Streptomyces sp. NPDC002564]|uniref:monovalent cation/H+ antiporter complex subunit F n=1 Tax=Streptomyces sp. NPDC002564 TaxID=3364649 RepID=UPI003693ABDB
MNGWLCAALVLLVCGLGPALWVACRGPAAERLVGLAFASTCAPAVFLALAEGYGRPSYADVALVAVVLGPVGVLVFARCLPEED